MRSPYCVIMTSSTIAKSSKSIFLYKRGSHTVCSRKLCFLPVTPDSSQFENVKDERLPNKTITVLQQL